ncbi:hypothetical protein H2203_007950 [Taxawa tesnikishii (nom. ined.)]|nr:hypothetical protein H2203_007950 [Dothideales sp. JES 119]
MDVPISFLNSFRTQAHQSAREQATLVTKQLVTPRTNLFHDILKFQTTTHTHSTIARFQDLPVEIRLKIFRTYLSDAHFTLPNMPRYQANRCAIIRVCLEFQTEVEHVFRETATLNITVGPKFSTIPSTATSSPMQLMLAAPLMEGKPTPSVFAPQLTEAPCSLQARQVRQHHQRLQARPLLPRLGRPQVLRAANLAVRRRLLQPKGRHFAQCQLADRLPEHPLHLADVQRRYGHQLQGIYCVLPKKRHHFPAHWCHGNAYDVGGAGYTGQHGLESILPLLDPSQPLCSHNRSAPHLHPITSYPSHRALSHRHSIQRKPSPLAGPYEKDEDEDARIIASTDPSSQIALSGINPAHLRNPNTDLHRLFRACPWLSAADGSDDAGAERRLANLPALDALHRECLGGFRWLDERQRELFAQAMACLYLREMSYNGRGGRRGLGGRVWVADYEMRERRVWATDSVLELYENMEGLDDGRGCGWCLGMMHSRGGGGGGGVEERSSSGFWWV